MIAVIARRAALVAATTALSACGFGTRADDRVVETVPPSPATALETATAAATVRGTPAADDTAVATGTGTLVVDGGGIRTFDCAGRDVHVTVDDNIVRLRGRCPALRINSDDNVIDVEAVGIITIDGSNNVISYETAIGGLEPVVEDNGVLNVIDQSSL